MLTNHRREEPFVQQESVKLPPGHTIDTGDDPKHNSESTNVIHSDEGFTV